MFSIGFYLMCLFQFFPNEHHEEVFLLARILTTKYDTITTSIIAASTAPTTIGMVSLASSEWQHTT